MPETIERLKADIAAKGILFFSEIDQTALAREAGIDLPVDAARLRQPPRHALPDVEPDSGLDWPAGATPRPRGRARPGLGRLHRFRRIARRHGITDRAAEFAKASPR